MSCTYLGFVYGDGTLYGACSFSIGEVALLSRDTIRVTFDRQVVVNDAYKSTSNYTVSAADGSVLNVRKVLAPLDGSLQTDEVVLALDKAVQGVEYTVSVSSSISSVEGYPVVNTATFTGRNTKVDDVVSSIPAHYDMSPGSNIRALIQAAALEDDKIGGQLL